MELGRRSKTFQISEYTWIKMGLNFEKFRRKQDIAYDKKSLQFTCKKVSE
jgi:hypothetical protein